VTHEQRDPFAEIEARRVGEWKNFLLAEPGLLEGAATPPKPPNRPCDPRPTERQWPKPLAEQAFYGITGDIVRTIEPHTEADPAALLAQTLAAFGNVIGRSAYFRVEADRHCGNIFAVLVGVTAKGRKGTSLGQVRSVFENVDPEWAAPGGSIVSGLSSGEGLIWNVRDAIEKRRPVRKNGQVTEYEMIIEDDGVSDKRLFVVEAEFASPLRVMARDGNTLSAVLRDAWDTGDLRTLTKNSPAQATGGHISVIGHVTQDELLRYLNSTEMANGFANRFLWFCVRRSKELPEGGQAWREDFLTIVERLKVAVIFARSATDLRRDEAARQVWREVYGPLSEGKLGLLGSVTSRAEAQVVRLSLLYALLDCSAVIRREHLHAALAVWDYCEASAKYIFGDSLGDPEAERILLALRANTRGLTRTEIRDLFGRNQREPVIEAALTALQERGLARRDTRQTGGRPAEHWTVDTRVQRKRHKWRFRRIGRLYREGEAGMPSYLEIALRVASPAQMVHSEAERVENQSHSSHADVVTKSRVNPNNSAPCGSADCAGCYDVGDGRKIHPPKCGQQYLECLLRCRVNGKIQRLRALARAKDGISYMVHA
jgi:hypothetical protein